MRTSQESPNPPVRPLGVLAFPWLLSSTVHTGLFLLLAMSWTATRPTAPGAKGISLEVGMLSSSSRSGANSNIRVEIPAEGYFDDEPGETPSPSDDDDHRGAAGGAALTSLLNEEPAVNLAGVLPSSGTGESSGGKTTGVVGAAELTGQPAPPTRVSGGTALTGVFGVKGEGSKFVYVFDRSGSMDGHSGAPLAAAKSELIASLGDLGQTHQFQIIFYNEQPRIFNPAGRSGRLVFGTDQNKNLARRFIGSITASGATRHIDALKMALRMNPDVIFFLTDADEPRMSPKDLADIAQMNPGCSINAIEFGYGTRHNSDNFLVALARQNGGQHAYIDVSQLPAVSRQSVLSTQK